MLMNNMKLSGLDYRGTKYVHPGTVGAGVGITISPDAGDVWMVNDLKFHLTTAVAAANRYVRTYFYGPTGTPPVVVYYPINFQTAIPASKLAYYFLNSNCQYVAGTTIAMTAGTSAADFHSFWRLPEIFLYGNTGGNTSDQIFIDAVNIQGADQFASCHMQVHWWTQH